MEEEDAEITSFAEWAHNIFDGELYYCAAPEIANKASQDPRLKLRQVWMVTTKYIYRCL